MKKMLTILGFVLIGASLTLSSCKKDPSCSDGKKNQNETAVDCGGECPVCDGCDDGIKNGSETGIDCGGDCAPCNSASLCNKEAFSAAVGEAFTPFDAVSIQEKTSGSSIRVTASDGSTHKIVLILHSGMKVGGYDIRGLSATATQGAAEYYNLSNPSNQYQATGGTLNIAENKNHSITGQFSFTAQESKGDQIVTINAGFFCVDY